MSKHRNWWMGLGLGIILGACLLEMIHFANRNNSQALQIADGGKKYTQQQLNDEVAKAVKAARKEQTPAPTVSPTAPAAKPTPSPSASASSPASAKPNKEAGKIVAFYVNSGMDLKTVARSLKKLGVIEDAEDFTDEARTIAKDVQPGTSMFTGKPTYKEIIAELTRTKDN
jgi:hypothetical protein